MRSGWKKNDRHRVVSGFDEKGVSRAGENPRPADAIWFIQSDTIGSWDYMKEHKQWLDKDFDMVMAGIKEHRKKKSW